MSQRTQGIRRDVTMTLALVAMAVAGVAQNAPANEPLAGLSIEKGQLAWDGIALGTSLVRAERLLGVTLAVDHGNGESPCAKWIATSERNGLLLTLGFASPRPGAKVEWLRVRFEGNQILASAEDLVASLNRQVPGARWIQPDDAASLEEDLRPVFEVPGTKDPQVVRLAPREWMVLARAGCAG